MAKRTAVYPGTFDPITYGHIDIIKRASLLFDKVIVSVVKSSSKNTLFTYDERADMAKVSLAKFKNVQVTVFEGLLVEHAKAENANVLIRGLRGVSDFEYEFQMALTNRKIAPVIETIFLMPSENFSYISSTFIKDIAKNKGNVKDFVNKYVKKQLEKKFS